MGVYASNQHAQGIIMMIVYVSTNTVWVENFEGSNFRESKNFLYFEIFAGIKFRVPSQR